jgi:16S rRNA processing protein RimM
MRPQRSEKNRASPGPDETAPPLDMIAIGEVLTSWGLKGHVRIYNYADTPETYKQIRELYIRKENRTIPLEIREAREHKGGVILKFKGRERIEEVEELFRETLYMHKRDLAPLEPGEHYWHQLIGMEVRTDTGKELGTLREILCTGSNDVYVVRQGEREILVPAIRDVIREVDVNENRMTVHPLEGMLDEHDL